MLTLAPGTTLVDRYRILRSIGKGGMGAVYEAVDLRLHNAVAVKQLTAQGDEAVRAFRQEAELLATLRHAGLAVVIDFFVEGEGCFLVMQYIEGEDLGQILKRTGSPSRTADVQAWAIAVLEVLAYLHGQTPAIIHRDIKPANIKLTPGGEVVLLDFGLAKGGSRAATSTGDPARSVYGFTANYAPPEQLEYRVTDARSDVYALGATLFHLSTGVPPPSAHVRVGAIAAGHPDPLLLADRLNPEVGRAFGAALARALELDPAARFTTADEMMLAVISCLQPGPAAAARPGREARASDVRRLDAAMSSQAEVERQIDLIVQIRFADSPRLGLEDWPTKRLPEKIEQGSETLRVEYPIDARSGNRLPARLRVKLVTADFSIEGANEYLIDVPPEEYSKRLVFLITPRRAGFCRINVEVYAVDAVHLGTVPVEAEAVVGQVANPVRRVANLLLGLFAVEEKKQAPAPPAARAQMPPGAEPRMPPPATRLAPELGPMPAHPPFLMAPEGYNPGSPESPPVPIRAPSEETPLSAPASAAVPPPMASSRGLPRWLYIVAPMAVLATSLIVYQRSGPMSTDLPNPVSPVASSSVPPTSITPPAVTPEPAVPRPTPAVATPPTDARLEALKKAADAAREAARREAEAKAGATPSTVETPRGAVRPPPPSSNPRPDPAKPAPAPSVPGGGTGRVVAIVPPAPPEPPAPMAPKTATDPAALPIPPPPPDVLAKKSIESTLERFRIAMESMDFVALRQIFPSATDQFVAQFKQIKTVAYAFSGAPRYLDLDLTVGTARVEVPTARMVVRTVGGESRMEGTTAFELRKGGGDTWVITRHLFNVK